MTYKQLNNTSHSITEFYLFLRDLKYFLLIDEIPSAQQIETQFKDSQSCEIPITHKTKAAQKMLPQHKKHIVTNSLEEALQQVGL